MRNRRLDGISETRHVKWSPVLSIVLLVMGFVVKAPVNASQTDTVPATLGAKLQAILNQAHRSEKSHYPGVSLRIESPLGVWSGTAGIANVVTKLPVDDDMKYRAASNIVPFVSVVVLQLIEEGKFTLDTKITELLPLEVTKLFPYSKSITIKMLLNHTSGIGEWKLGLGDQVTIPVQPARIWKDMELLKMAQQEGIKFKPGEKWSYNATETTLLGMVIDRVTEKSWRQNIRERIIAKLALRNTNIPEVGTMKISGPYLSGYSLYSGGLLDVSEIDPSFAGAAGGHAFVSTNEDLSIFIRALFEGQLFHEKETLSAMLQTVETGERGQSYGLGVAKYISPNGMLIYGHTGGTTGYSSVMFYLPKSDITAVSVISNRQGTNAIIAYLMPALAAVVQYHSENKSKS